MSINNKYLQIYNAIHVTAQSNDWKPISTKNENMMSFTKQSQRINICIKQNMRITI